MTISKAYNTWAATYDHMQNKTRDLEAQVIRKCLEHDSPAHLLELGCGTGKNSSWLSSKTEQFIGLDFSEEMLKKARKRSYKGHREFKTCDLKQIWPVEDAWADLISCSLVLEHIEDLDFIFNEAARVSSGNGRFYVCELHPYKQYKGSKARFETKEGTQELEVYTHNVSDYLNAASENGFDLVSLQEHFDEDEEQEIPRLISFLFKKRSRS